MEIKNLNILNTKEKQILAAKCFSKYCFEKGISHQYIDELIEHLLSIQNTKNLPFWEAEGAKLKLNGRGDELPKEIEIILETKDKKAFLEILESAVEVGIVDMYGTETKQPEIYLKKCISILSNNYISIPKVEF